MKKLIFILVIAGAVWHWQKGGFTKIASVDASGNPVVTVFTASDCGPACRMTVGELEKRGVPFLEKRIDPGNDEDKDTQVWRRIGNNTLPMTLYGNEKLVGASKWELISLLGTNFGSRYILPEEQAYFQRHFDASGAPMIVLYGASWCPSCQEMRKQFREHGVDFVDIDVERSGEFNRLTKVMEIPGYPAVWVGYTRVHGTTYSAVMDVAKNRT